MSVIFPSELCCQHRQKIWLITRYAEKHIGDTNCLPCGITEIGRLKQMPTICFWWKTILLTNFHRRLTHSHRPIGIVNTTSMRLWRLYIASTMARRPQSLRNMNEWKVKVQYWNKNQSLYEKRTSNWTPFRESPKSTRRDSSRSCAVGNSDNRGNLSDPAISGMLHALSIFQWRKHIATLAYVSLIRKHYEIL